MAQVLTLDYSNKVKELNTQLSVCVCCLAQDGKYVNLSTCKHTGFIEYFFRNKVAIQNSFICYLCHGILEKIDRFKNLIDQSCILLNKSATNEIVNKNHYFKRTDVHSYSILPKGTLDNSNGSSGINSTLSNAVQDTAMDVKEEYDVTLSPDVNVFVKEEDLNFDEEEECNVTLPLVEEVKQEPVVNKVNETKDVVQDVTDEDLQKYLEMRIFSREAVEQERESFKEKENYKKRPYKCEKCVIGYDHESTLKSHLDKKHNQAIGAYKCSICECIYNTESALKTHEKRHFTRVKCKICGKQYADERSASYHCAEKHGLGEIQNYYCGYQDCDFKSQSYRAYTYHLARHRQEPCVHCGKLYLRGTQMRLHINNVHNNMSTFKCELCDKQYKQRFGLNLHMQSVHKNDGTVHFCTLCRTQYRSASTLAHHMQHHSSHVEKKYMCDECGSRFATKISLRYHIQCKHFTTSKYKCTQCSKVLGTPRSLKRHVEFVHDKIRPPKDKICNHCGKAFRYSSYLKTHIRTHTGERPHVCPHCGATFTHPASLYTHKKLLHSASKDHRTRKRNVKCGTDSENTAMDD